MANVNVRIPANVPNAAGITPATIPSSTRPRFGTRVLPTGLGGAGGTSVCPSFSARSVPGPIYNGVDSSGLLDAEGLENSDFLNGVERESGLENVGNWFLGFLNTDRGLSLDITGSGNGALDALSTAGTTPLRFAASAHVIGARIRWIIFGAIPLFDTYFGKITERASTMALPRDSADSSTILNEKISGRQHLIES